MIIYLFEILMVFLLWNFKKYKIKIGKKTVDGTVFYLGVCFFMFGMTMALRKYTVGTDAATYYRMYQNIAHASSLKEALKVSKIPSAIVYVGMHYYITRLAYFPQLGMMINSFVIAYGFFCFIKRESKDYFLSCSLFIGLIQYYESMNGTRQFMAISLAINAFSILRRNWKNYRGWVLFLLAAGIHNTIVVFAVAYLGIVLAKRYQKIQKLQTVSMVISVCIALLFTTGVQIIVSIFPYYKMYVNGDNPVQIFASSGKGRIIILYLVLFAIMIIASRGAKKNTEFDEIKAYHFGCIFGIVMGILFSKNVLMNRILWPFLSMEIVYLPNLLNQCLEKQKRKILYAMSTWLPLAYSTVHLIEDKSGILPYLFFWQR